MNAVSLDSCDDGYLASSNTVPLSIRCSIEGTYTIVEGNATCIPIACRNETVNTPQHFKDLHVPSFLHGFNLTLSPLPWQSNESAVIFDSCLRGYYLNGSEFEVICSTNGEYEIVGDYENAAVCDPVVCAEYSVGEGGGNTC
jgi:hypothetical protein